MAPAAGKPTTVARGVAESSARPAVSNASRVAGQTPAAIESKPANEPLLARLEPVKVKQKYQRKAPAKLPVDERYLLKLPKGSYTLQLLGSSSKKGMRDFVKGHNVIEIQVFENGERIRVIDTVVSIVMLTGYGSINSAVSAMKEGVDEYITKPFSKEELLGTIRTLVH